VKPALFLIIMLEKPRGTPFLSLRSGFREVLNIVRNLDGACKAESLNPCYVGRLQVDRLNGQLNFYFFFILVTSQRKVPKQTKKNPTPKGDVQLKGDINASTIILNG
jgi:hypothetical protein